MRAMRARCREVIVSSGRVFEVADGQRAGSTGAGRRGSIDALSERCNRAVAWVETARLWLEQCRVRRDTVGSRVHKCRHNAIDALHGRTGEAAILAELLLRGPQTMGELRGRASRMVPLESTEAVKELLRALSDRGEPLVKEVPPS